MEFKTVLTIIRYRDVSDAAKLTLLEMLDQFQSAKPSLAELQLRRGAESRTTIQNHIRELVQAGLLRKKQVGPNNRCVYSLNKRSLGTKAKSKHPDPRHLPGMVKWFYKRAEKEYRRDAKEEFQMSQLRRLFGPDLRSAISFFQDNYQKFRVRKTISGMYRKRDLLRDEMYGSV